MWPKGGLTIADEEACPIEGMADIDNITELVAVRQLARSHLWLRF